MIAMGSESPDQFCSGCGKIITANDGTGDLRSPCPACGETRRTFDPLGSLLASQPSDVALKPPTPELQRWQNKHPHDVLPSDPEDICRAIHEEGTKGELRGALFVIGLSVALWLFLPHSVWMLLKNLALAAVGLLGFATG